MMSKNMSGYDRILRLLLGMLLIAFAIAGRVGPWAWVLGLFMLATASLARCPMYALLSFGMRKGAD